MLLRSASTPILNSWKPHSKETSPETETINQIPRSRSLALCASSKLPTPYSMTRALSESDLGNLPVAKKKQSESKGMCNGFYGMGEREAVESPRMALLDSGSYCDVDEGGERGNSGGGVGGGFCGIGGSNGGDDGCSGSWNANHEDDGMDLYYQKMIKANPENSLLLSNYALFLKEVRGDLLKAEEYCGRAILKNPNDGDVLSMYADLIWQNHKDASRAQSYFDQAAKVSPYNCYVLGSYARFLWDAEEEAEEDEEEDSFDNPSPTNFVFEVEPQPLPLTAAS